MAEKELLIIRIIEAIGEAKSWKWLVKNLPVIPMLVLPLLLVVAFSLIMATSVELIDTFITPYIWLPTAIFLALWGLNKFMKGLK